MCYNKENGLQGGVSMSRKNRILRNILLIVGLVCVAIGICFDGVRAVIANAIALCMSCIGLG